MSNAIFIDVNKVENVVTKAIYYVMEAWDNYSHGSVSINEEEIPTTDVEALQYLKDYGSDESESICDIIDTIVERESGVTINGTFYEWNEIRHLFYLDDLYIDPRYLDNNVDKFKNE